MRGLAGAAVAALEWDRPSREPDAPGRPQPDRWLHPPLESAGGPGQRQARRARGGCRNHIQAVAVCRTKIRPSRNREPGTQRAPQAKPCSQARWPQGGRDVSKPDGFGTAPTGHRSDRDHAPSGSRRGGETLRWGPGRVGPLPPATSLCRRVLQMCPSLAPVEVRRVQAGGV